MGELVHLEGHRRRRKGRLDAVATVRATLFVDLADPFSYLTAERVERVFASVGWRPASQAALGTDSRADVARTEAIREAAERRAHQLRMPLEWPDRFPAPVPAAMRAATYAAELGRGGEFVVAAGRLAFCGGFDLDDPEVLMEAAAAAGIPLEDCLAAAGDVARDAVVEVAGRRLLAVGADELPALRVGQSLLWGEARISAYLASGAPARAVLAP
jgi:2-hydroxychromene-2-carboxylate isomerase